MTYCHSDRHVVQFGRSGHRGAVRQRVLAAGMVTATILVQSACHEGDTSDFMESTRLRGTEVNEPGALVRIEFLEGRRSTTKLEVTVKVDLPEGVEMAAPGRPLLDATNGFPERLSPKEESQDGARYSYVFDVSDMEVAPETALELGPFILSPREVASVQVDLAAWLHRTRINLDEGGQADLLSAEIVRADPSAGTLRAIRIDPRRGLIASAVHFIFDADVGDWWVVQSDGLFGASVRGARNLGQPTEPSWRALTVEGLRRADFLQAVFTLTRIDAESIVQEDAFVVLSSTEG